MIGFFGLLGAVGIERIANHAGIGHREGLLLLHLLRLLQEGRIENLQRLGFLFQRTQLDHGRIIDGTRLAQLTDRVLDTRHLCPAIDTSLS